MRLGENNGKAAKRLNAAFAKLVNVRALFVMLALAGLIVTASANFKLG